MTEYIEIKSKQYRGNGFMTVAKYNNRGDIIYVGDKESKAITSICTKTYSILNKFNAHNGVVWSLDLSNDDNIMISCSGDLSICFFNAKTSLLLYQFNENCIPKFVSVQKNIQSNLACVLCEAITRRSKTYLLIYDLNDLTDLNNPNNSNAFSFKYKLMWNNSNRINCIDWIGENTLILGCDDGQIILRNIFDLEGTNESAYKFHDNQIKSLCWNKSFENILTSSSDSTSKIIDTVNWKVLNTFVSTVPINYACYNHNDRQVFIAGSVDTINVAKTSNNDLSLKIFKIKGSKLINKMECHFGPIRFISKSPSNKNFLTASQDGIVKIHIFNNVENESNEPNELNESNELNEPNELNELNELNKPNEPNELNEQTEQFNSDKIFLLDGVNRLEYVNWKPPRNTQNIQTQKWIPGMPKISNEFGKKSELFKVDTELNKSIENSIGNIREEQNRTNSSIRITNLPPCIDAYQLGEIFDLYGRIEDRGIRIKKYDDNTMAFINYVFPDAAHKAIAHCDGLPIEHYIIRVEMAQNKFI